MHRFLACTSAALLTLLLLGTPLTRAQDATPPDAGKPAAFKEQMIIPPGTPQETLEFFQRIKQQRPNLENEEQVRAHFQRVFETIAAGSAKLLAEKPNAELEAKLTAAHFEALVILNRLKDERAAAPMLALAEKLKEHKDREVADFARMQLLQVHLDAAATGTPGAAEKVIEELKAYCAGQPSGQRFDTGRQVARGLEMAGQYETALAAYDLLRSTFLKSAQLELGAAADDTAKAARKRIGVIGQKIQLDGTTVGGKPFDMVALSGKVVLVDFWATWCGPCLRELPNIKKNYEKYHDRGFEVVAISLDEDRSALETFLREQELPWTTLFSDNTQATQALANRFGVEGIPALLLVGRDGKVVTLKARGPDLGKELERLLGPVPEKAEPEKK